MDTRRIIIFDREERTVLARANVHLGIAFSGAELDGVRVVRRLAVRDPQVGTLANLRAAEEAYHKLLTVTHSEAIYWAAQHRRISGLTDSGTAPQVTEWAIIADPKQAAALLAETRALQVIEIEAALHLVRAGLAILPAVDAGTVDEKTVGV